MSQIRLLFTFFAALIVALAASYLVYKQVARRAEPLAGTTRIFVAARDLPIGVPLGAEDLKETAWTSETTPAGAVTDSSKLVGRSLIYPVFAGEPVLMNKLAAEGSGAGLSAVISEGMRAVSIRVDEVVAVAGFVVAGTRVDVLLTGSPTENGGADRVTQTILENAQVLAAGQQIQPDAEGKPESVNVVTLLCTPEDAARVVLAASEGRIQLVLRNPADGQADGKPTPVVKRTQLFARAAPPPPPPAVRAPAPRVEPPAPVVVVPPPPTTAAIQVIRGSNVSEVEVPLTHQ
jgi:pilus assembly protein CpaB